MPSDFPYLDKEKIIGHPECSINKKGIHNTSNKDMVKTYKCEDCNTKDEDFICEGCKEKCHKNHKCTLIETKQVSSFICYCAKTNHNPDADKNQNKNFQELKENSDTKYCSLERFYKLLKYNYMFRNKKNKKNYCAFCAINCDIHNHEAEKSQNQQKENNPNSPDDEDELFINENDMETQERNFFDKLKTKRVAKSDLMKTLNQEFEKILVENPKDFTCECKMDSNHIKEKEYLNLSKLIRKKIYEVMGININNFRYVIFDRNASHNLYNEILAVYINKNGIINKGGLKNDNEIADIFSDYIPKAKVIEAIGNNYKKSNVLFSGQHEYEEFFNSFDINFLLRIFSLPVTQLDKNIVMLKKLSLRIFRKFYLNPVINSKNFYSDQVDANITPIHRKLSKRDYSIHLFHDIDINIERFLNLLEKVQMNVSSYFNEFYSTRSAQELFKLYNELFHILNILVKYHLNDKHFVETQINSIYNFLKKLFENQQHGKIYMLKKQILKLITKFALKMNDERFFQHIDIPEKKKMDFGNELDEYKFCFQNTEINNMMFKIFLMINHKTFSCQTIDNILTEKVQYFLNLMMIENDGFVNNLDFISKNKKFAIDFEKDKYSKSNIKDQYQKDILENVQKLLDEFETTTINLYKNNLNESDYMNKVQEVFTSINNVLFMYINQNKNNPTSIQSLQYYLYSDGYYTKLMHILNNIREISMHIHIKVLKKNYELIFKNILLFTYENPFLALLFVTHKFTKILFHNEPEYNVSLFNLYSKLFKMLNKFDYRIDPRPFFDNFKIHFNKENIFNLETNEKYEDLYHIGSIYDNIISITNSNIKQIIYQMISEEIKDIFESDLFSNKLHPIIDKLKNDPVINNLPDKERHLIWSYKNFLKILNHMSDGHFIATISNINIEATSSIVEKLLKVQFLHPNLRRGLICFYTKSKIQLPYKILKSSEFNNEVFQSMTKEIPYMTEDYETIFSTDKQKEELETVIEELLIYPQNIIKHEEYYKEHKKAFFKYFAEAVYLPSMNCMYKIAYFNDKINSDLKYAVYRILVLFSKCFYFFLKNIELFNFWDPNLFLDYLCIDVFEKGNSNKDSNSRRNNENIKNLLQSECSVIKELLVEDLKNLEEENFLIKDNILFEIFMHYKKYYFLKNKIFIHGNDEEENDNSEEKNNNKKNESNSNIIKPPPPNQPEIQYLNIANSDRPENNNPPISSNRLVDSKNNDSKSSENEALRNNNTEYMERILTFLEDFKEKKNEEDDLIYQRIFADEQSYREKFANPNAIIDFKLREEFKRSYFLLLFDNIIDYERKCENLSYEYQESTSNTLENLVKVFKIDPEFCQNELLEDKNKENSVKLMEEMIRRNLTCMFQIVFIEFNVITSNEGKSTYKNITNILEFIRLHCENHNRIFQTFLCYFDIIDPQKEKKTEEDDKKFYLINFILKIFKLVYDFVNFKLRKKEILGFFGQVEIHFFDDLLEKIVEFLVEIYQGNYPKNFEFLVKGDYDFNSGFLEIFLKTFDDITDVIELEIIVMNFMTFYLSLIEDYDMADEYKDIITKKLNLKLILATIKYCIKKCKIKVSDNLNEGEDVAITEGTAYELLEAYKTDKNEISDYHLFKLMTKCYILLKILADLKNSKANDLLNDLKVSKTNKKDALSIQNYETNLLLTSLVKNVEINFSKTKSAPIKDVGYLKEVLDQDILDGIDEAQEKNSGNENEEDDDAEVKPVNFLIHNESLFLTNEDFNIFQEKIPIDNYNSKLYDLVSNIPDVVKAMKFKKKLFFMESKLILLLSSLNYKIFEYISILLVFVVNIMMQWTMTYDKINSRNSPFYSMIIYISIGNIGFLALVIFNYMFFKFLAIEKRSGVGVLEFMSNLFNDEVFFLLWNMIIGIVAISSTICHFLFSLQLFSIISFFDTMKTILMTIKLRWKQFTSTAILIVILIIFFTGISFYFIRSYYLLQDLDLNVCSNYIYCFLTIFSYGVRLGGGIGDLIGLVRYNDPNFWYLFFFQWIFYFSIVLIMLNVINGIIVDTFQDLREKNNTRNNIRNNDCYICGINRIDFQISSLDFEAHKINDHNVHNYIYYLIKINEMDEQDLNSVDYQSLMCCRKKQTSFFPMKKCIALIEKKKSK